MSEMLTASNEATPFAKYVRGIDHLAIAVPDLDASLVWFTSVLGFTLKERRETEGRISGMVSAVLVAANINIVLLQGTNSESQVSKFIEHYGPGVQHVALAVSNIDALASEMKEVGLLFDTSVIGTGSIRQLFSTRDPRSGLMLEFIERTREGFDDGNVASLFEQLESKGAF